jgi:hypothetical protein
VGVQYIAFPVFLSNSAGAENRENESIFGYPDIQPLHRNSILKKTKPKLITLPPPAIQLFRYPASSRVTNHTGQRAKISRSICIIGSMFRYYPEEFLFLTGLFIDRSCT